MRKTSTFLIAAVVLVGIFFVLKNALPKYAGFLPFFLILLLLDVYLWYSVKNKFSSGKTVIKYLFIGLYWLPLMLLVSSVLTGFAVPFKEWNIAYRTYLMGICHHCLCLQIYCYHLSFHFGCNKGSSIWIPCHSPGGQE